MTHLVLSLPVVLWLGSSTVVTFHVAGDPIPLLLPGRIHVHVRLAVAVVVILVPVVGEELCVFIGGPTKKNTSSSCDASLLFDDTCSGSCTPPMWLARRSRGRSRRRLLLCRAYSLQCSIVGDLGGRSFPDKLDPLLQSFLTFLLKRTLPDPPQPPAVPAQPPIITISPLPSSSHSTLPEIRPVLSCRTAPMSMSGLHLHLELPVL